MKRIVSNAIKASIAASVLAAPVSAETSPDFFEDDADFSNVPESVDAGSGWNVDELDLETATATGEVECEENCKSFQINGSNTNSDFSASIWNAETGAALGSVALGGTVELSVPGTYVIDVSVGPWVNFCYPEGRKIVTLTEDSDSEISYIIGCE